MAAQTTAERYARIWDTVLQIPAGKVASYGQVADLAGLPGRARMIGRALGAAPPELELPWFRVLRADGSLAFPPHSRHARRQADLLAADGVEVIRNRVDLGRHGWQPDLAALVFQLRY